MRIIVKKLMVCLAVLGSALLFMGSSVIPPDPPPSRIIWTQDGKHIIFSTPFQGVFVVDVAGKRLSALPKRKPAGNSYNPGNSTPAVSQVDSRVAFVTFEKYSAEVIRGPTPHEFLGLVFLLAFSISDGSRALIQTTAIDGTGVRQLTNFKDLNSDGEVDFHNEFDPVWSPDGKHIAFKSNQSIYFSDDKVSHAEARLSIMNEDGSNVRVLAPSVSVEARDSARTFSGSRPPLWSPDGRWIAFVGLGKTGGEQKESSYRHFLYTVRPDGSDLTRVAETKEYGLLKWSPDSSRLAFTAPDRVEKGETSDALYTVHAAGSGLAKVADNLPSPQEYDRPNLELLTVDLQATWSPDSEWLAFAKEDKDGSGIYVAKPDGTGLRRVLSGYGAPVSWSSDGAELYVSGVEYAVRLDGSGLRPLLSDNVLAIHKSPYPALAALAWSPDGSRLAVLSVSLGNEYAPLLYTVTRDGTEVRVLARGTKGRIVAEHSGWHIAPHNLAACVEGHVVPEPETNSGLVHDCETLLKIRNSLIGEGYVNWNSLDPITEWDGVTVGCPLDYQAVRVTPWEGVELGCHVSLRVTGLHLDGLVGFLPADVGKLSGLQSLNLARGTLTGRIPSTLGYLTSLKELNLESNSLSGGIPSELGKLSNLTVLSLSNNALSGTIPPELGNLSQLRVLHLDQSFLESGLIGSIPTELGNLSKLRSLHLQNNELSGNIPSELGRLFELREINLVHNRLSGEIPPELGRLSKLKELRLGVTLVGTNQFSGGIPITLGSLANLRVLHLGSSGLTGPIPPELGKLRRLEQLFLDRNKLSGSIPPELGNLKQLKQLYLSGNSLTGMIPQELGQLTSLQGLAIAENNLSGFIPLELGNLSNLQWLALSENGLSGTIPSTIGSLNGLLGLDLRENRLTGPVPPELRNLSNLWWIDVSQNELTGCVPKPKLPSATKAGVRFCS